MPGIKSQQAHAAGRNGGHAVAARGGGRKTAWPTKPVRVMVPYPPAGAPTPPGGSYSAPSGKLFNQQFVVEKPWRGWRHHR